MQKICIINCCNYSKSESPPTEMKPTKRQKLSEFENEEDYEEKEQEVEPRK